jgi:hypothetical protein
MEAVANGYNPGYGSLPGFLNNNKLLNGGINNKPQVGVSIKILHRFSPKDMIKTPSQEGAPQVEYNKRQFQTGYYIVTQPPGGVNKMFLYLILTDGIFFGLICRKKWIFAQFYPICPCFL